jgi:chromate transporter
LRFWIKLGFISFGGPAGQIAIMHRELVEKNRWISDAHFLHALNFCMLLPGPEAQQLATYLGWRLHGARGGIAAGIWFVLPSVFLLFGLSWLYMAGGHLPWLAAIFYGLLAAVIAVVAEAILRIGKKALRSPALWAVAALSFVAIHFFGVSFVLIIFSAAVTGWAGNRLFPAAFPAAGGGHGASSVMANEPSAVVLAPASSASPGRSVRLIALSLVLWGLPLLALGLWLGWESTPVQQGIFFTKAAFVTFGGAYAVLPYVAQQAVDQRRLANVRPPDQRHANIGLRPLDAFGLRLVRIFDGVRRGKGAHRLVQVGKPFAMLGRQRDRLAKPQARARLHSAREQTSD